MLTNLSNTDARTMCTFTFKNANSSTTMEVKNIAKNATNLIRHTVIGKSFLLAVLFCSSTFGLYAQDIITKKDGTEIQAKVIEIGTSEVKYTRFDASLPIYTLVKSDIFMIKYEDGTKDLFEEASTAVTDTNDTRFSNPDQKIYGYTFGKPINPVGGCKSAWGSGIASFFIPGLGQFINGDVGAGFLYLGSNIICNTIMLSSLGINSNGDAYINPSTFTIGFMGALTVNIASIVNAVHIAKRVNMARGYPLANNTYLQILPTIIPQNQMFANNDFAYGINFKVNF